MADPPPLKTKEEMVKLFLRGGAVADASHDFQGGRAAAAEGIVASAAKKVSNIFDAIFGKQKYKDIGAPKTLSDDQDTIRSEAEIMDLLLHFLKPAGRGGGRDEVENFREKFLRLGEEEGHPVDLGVYSRWTDDPHPFKVTSLMVAKKPKGAEYDWTLGADALYDFLDPHGADEVAFTIDAAGVSFYDLLLNEKRPASGTPPKTLYYIETREGINDAATKAVMQPDTSKKAKAAGIGKEPVVQIVTKSDTAPYSVMYTAIDVARVVAGAAGSELESFFSDYSLSLSPIAATVAGIPSTVLSFRGGAGFEHNQQILRTNTEDSHPNSVPTLSQRIRGLMSKLFGASAEEKAKYHVSLQQKRSGDWLQVLSCLQPERFGLKPSTRIMLFTLDKICLAYAIFMGVDVTFTYTDTQRQKWLIRFHRDLGAVPKTEFELFQEKVRALPAPTFGAGVPYATVKSVYMETRSARLADIRRALGETIGKVAKAVEAVRGTRQAFPVDEKVKEILTSAMALAVFRTLCPGVTGMAASPELSQLSSFVNRAETPGRRGKLREARETYEQYKSNYMILKGGIATAPADADEAAIKKAIRDYVAGMESLQGADKKAAAGVKDTYKELNNLRILDGSLFRKENAGANGMGVFTYLKAGLLAEELGVILGSLRGLGESLDDRKRTKYNAFFATAELLLGVAAAEGPATTEVKNEDLVDTLQGVNGEALIPMEGEVEVAPSDPLAISDYSAALIVLASRFQRDLFAAAEGAIPLRGGARSRKRLRSSATSGTRSKTKGSREISRGFRDAGENFVHNPLVSVYFFLRELAFRLSLKGGEEDEMNYKVLSMILNGYIRNPRLYTTDEGGVAAQRFYDACGIEAFLLEAYNHVGIFRGAPRIMRGLCATIVGNYYGVRREIELVAAKRYGNRRIREYIPIIDDAVIKAYVSMPAEDVIKANMASMSQIPNLVRILEELRAGGAAGAVAAAVAAAATPMVVNANASSVKTVSPQGKSQKRARKGSKSGNSKKGYRVLSKLASRRIIRKGVSVKPSRAQGSRVLSRALGTLGR